MDKISEKYIRVLDVRSYTIRRTLDIHIAAMAIRRPDIFSGISQDIRNDTAAVILELGTNIIKYAGSGSIILRLLEGNSRTGVEVIAQDNGPGISNPAQALEDHFSTGQSLGLGLGVVKRLSSEFELTCLETGGVQIRARRWWLTDMSKKSILHSKQIREASTEANTKHFPARESLNVTSYAYNRPALHQSKSGDSHLIIDHGLLSIRVVIDGAGHGNRAHAISSQIHETLHTSLTKRLAEVDDSNLGENPHSTSVLDELMMTSIDETHHYVHGSLGAAVGLAIFDRLNHRIHFLGVGNTRILLLRSRGWEGVSRDGMLGAYYRSPNVYHYPLESKDIVVQASDGIRMSTLREIRPKIRRDENIDLMQLANDLLRQTTYSDDASIILTKCYA